jgi:uncharacterized protein YacL
VTVATADTNFRDRTTLAGTLPQTLSFTLQWSSVDARDVLFGRQLKALSRLVSVLLIADLLLAALNFGPAFAYLSLLVVALSILTLYFVVRFKLTRRSGLPSAT